MDLTVTRIGYGAMQLLRRAVNILLIPGTSSVAHLRANVAGAMLPLSAEDIVALNSIAA